MDARPYGPLFFLTSHTGRECCSDPCLYCGATCRERGTIRPPDWLRARFRRRAGDLLSVPGPSLAPRCLCSRILTVLQRPPSCLCTRDFSSSSQLTSFSRAFAPFSTTQDPEATTEPRLLCSGASGSLGTEPPSGSHALVETVQAALTENLRHPGDCTHSRHQLAPHPLGHTVRNPLPCRLLDACDPWEYCPDLWRPSPSLLPWFSEFQPRT